MKTVIKKSLAFSFISVILNFLISSFFETSNYLTDIGGLGAFVTVFGTLFGIMTAFVVFEVWNQYNKTINLINLEAQGLERLFVLTLYFRDTSLTVKMKQAIATYIKPIVTGKFQTLALGKRNVENGMNFRNISKLLMNLSFNDDHDALIFSEIIKHYGNLAEIRTNRIDQSLARLPKLLKVFLYSSSGIALLSFIFMPFANQYYGYFVNGTLAFILGMVFQLVNDLDNPFDGQWNVTPEPFERALTHIENDY